MTPSKFNHIFGIGAMALLLFGGAAAASGDAPAVPLTAGQIFETMRENYASLASYSDEGRILMAMDGETNATDFTTRLARRGNYRIQWNQPDSPYDTGLYGAWSSGAGSYTQLEGSGVRRLFNRDSALVNLASSAGGEMAAIPTLFFNPPGIDWADKIIDLDRLADNKLGKIECYVLIGGSASGETMTLWIGKDDLLIHQIHTEASAKVMDAAWTGITGHLIPTGNVHGFSSFETFTNIVVNKKFSRKDFIPSFPLVSQ